MPSWSLLHRNKMQKSTAVIAAVLLFCPSPGDGGLLPPFSSPEENGGNAVKRTPGLAALDPPTSGVDESFGFAWQLRKPGGMIPKCRIVSAPLFAAAPWWKCGGAVFYRLEERSPSTTPWSPLPGGAVPVHTLGLGGQVGSLHSRQIRFSPCMPLPPPQRRGRSDSACVGTGGGVRTQWQ